MPNTKFLQTNFQAIVTTDERISFAIYLYDEQDLGDLIGVPPVFRGFSAADTIRSFGIGSRAQEQIFRIDGILQAKHSSYFKFSFRGPY